MVKKKEIKKIKKENLSKYYIISLTALIIFIYLFLDIHNGWVFSEIDLKINSITIQNHLLTSISKVITDTFHPIVFILMTLLIVIYLIYKKRKKEAIVFGLVLIIAKVIVDLIKILIERARPENGLVFESTYAFPSSHALMAVIFFGFLVYLIDLHIKSKINKEILSGLALLSALVMGLTRIILSVHWFSDVVAGFALGIFLLFLAIIVVKKEKLLKN